MVLSLDEKSKKINDILYKISRELECLRNETSSDDSKDMYIPRPRFYEYLEEFENKMNHEVYDWFSDEMYDDIKDKTHK